MPVKSNVPIRIGGSRHRSGCKTCKQRHVKCDEHRPVCTRCERANRECVYEDPTALPRRSAPPSQDNSEVGVSHARQHLNHSAWPSLNSSIYPSGSFKVLETSAIQHFATLLGRELAGGFSNDVWCQVIPRVAQHEPSIWHAAVAVSTLDTNLRLTYVRDTATPNQMAIMHYSKAIQALHKRLEDARDASCKETILLSCILFAVFECLQSHYKSALRHISGGMKLLAEWDGMGPLRNQVDLGSYLDRTTLQSIFLTLDSQAINMGIADFRESFSGSALDDQLPTPSSFSSVEDAYLLLNQIFHRMSHWSNWHDPDTACGNRPDEAKVLLEQQKIQAQLDGWDSAFEASVVRFRNEASTLLLRVQRNAIHACFERNAGGPSELSWDKCLPLFEEAVTLAECYTQQASKDAPGSMEGSEPGSMPSRRPRPVLTITMDIVLALFLISARCRDSGVRKRAFKLLQTCDRKEGIWDSQVLSGMVGKIIEAEEAAALENGFIPESARVNLLDVRFGEERTAKVSHRALSQEAGGYYRTEIFAENIAW